MTSEGTSSVTVITDEVTVNTFGAAYLFGCTISIVSTSTLFFEHSWAEACIVFVPAASAPAG